MLTSSRDWFGRRSSQDEWRGRAAGGDAGGSAGVPKGMIAPATWPARRQWRRCDHEPDASVLVARSLSSQPCAHGRARALCGDLGLPDHRSFGTRESPRPTGCGREPSGHGRNSIRNPVVSAPFGNRSLSCSYRVR